MKKIPGGHLNILAFLSNQWYRERFNYKNKDFGAQEPPQKLLMDLKSVSAIYWPRDLSNFFDTSVSIPPFYTSVSPSTFCVNNETRLTEF